VLSGSSNILEMLDVCVVSFESTTELCIAEDEGDSMYGEGWEEGVELGTLSCESCIIIERIILGRVLYSMFFRLNMSFVWAYYCCCCYQFCV
jgi:hypothetical protein